MQIGTSSSACAPSSVRRLAVGWVCLLTLAGPPIGAGSSEAAATLRWKFKPGEVVRYSMNQTTTNSYKPKNGVQAESVMTQVVDLHWTVKSVSAEGVAELTQTIDRVRARIEGAGQPSAFKFDSEAAADATQEPQDGPIAAQLVPLLKTLVGAEFTFKMSELGELSDIKVPERLLESVRRANSGGGKSVFSDEGMKNLVTQSSLTLPQAPLDSGKNWRRQDRIPLPLLGTMILDKTYTLKGADGDDPRRVQIALVTKVTIQPATEAGVDLKINRQDGGGVFSFDLDRGRVVSSRVEDLLVMSLSASEREIEQSTKTVTEMKLSPDLAAKSSQPAQSPL